MAGPTVTTRTSQRQRTEVKTFSEAVLGDLETSFAAYETAKAADITATWSVRVVDSYYDGTNFILIAEAYYPEKIDDGTLPL